MFRILQTLRRLGATLSDRVKYNPINLLYEEAQMPQKIRRSLNFIILGNIMGSAHGIICGGGTTAMIGLATELGANDMAFGVLSAIPQVAALLQLPFSVLVNRTHKRKKYMLTIGIFSRILWLLFGLIPYTKSTLCAEDIISHFFPKRNRSTQKERIFSKIIIASC